MSNVIWVDKKDNVLGEISYEKSHKEGLLHRVATVYLVRNNGDILVQKRKGGRLDHSSAGHVDVGETYKQAAARELEEELGVTGVELTEVGRAVSDEKYPESSDHTRHMFLIFETKAEPGKLCPEEIEEVFWANPVEVYEDMQKTKGERKYCGGFESSLKCFLEAKNIQP